MKTSWSHPALCHLHDRMAQVGAPALQRPLHRPGLLPLLVLVLLHHQPLLGEAGVAPGGGGLEAGHTAGLPVDEGEQEVLQHHAHNVPAGDEETGQTETEEEMFSETCRERCGGDGD